MMIVLQVRRGEVEMLRRPQLLNWVDVDVPRHAVRVRGDAHSDAKVETAKVSWSMGWMDGEMSNMAAFFKRLIRRDLSWTLSDSAVTLCSTIIPHLTHLSMITQR